MHPIIKSLLRLNLALLILMSLFKYTLAHHSNAPHFDNEVEITKTGTVSEWKFVNPHAYLYFDVKNDDDSTTTWRCETSAASALKRRGFSQDTFRVGEQVTVTGNPARREENSCFTYDFILADGTVIDRSSILNVDESGQVIASTAERAAYLPSGEPNISGYWWDGDDNNPIGGSAQAPSGPPLGGGMTGMGMGMGMAGQTARLARLSNIPITPEGEKLRDEYEFIYDDPSLQCRIANIMDALGRDESVNEIRQSDDTITILYGYMDYLRTIYLNKNEHPENLELSLGGHSIGRWEDETLIVETIGFLPSVLHPRVGIPTSDQLKIVERFTYDHDALELNREYTATDPTYLLEEFSGQDTLRISQTPYEPYNCEPLSGINNLRPGTPEYEAELNKHQENQ